jgi:hypothetical protein
MLGQFLMALTQDIDVRVIPTCPPPVLTPKEVFHLILNLDSIVKPGVRAAVFENLFARCHACDMVMTRRIFQYHECAMEEEEVIDLTMDED